LIRKLVEIYLKFWTKYFPKKLPDFPMYSFRKLCCNMGRIRLCVFAFISIHQIEGFFRPQSSVLHVFQMEQQSYKIPTLEKALTVDCGNHKRRNFRRECVSLKAEEKKVQYRPPDLPQLCSEDQELLISGERVQRQSRNGKRGMGFGCVEVRSDELTAWSMLLDFRRYPAFMSTIRDAIVFNEEENTTKAEFMISRFRFPIRCEMCFNQEKQMLRFELDPECKVPAGVFKAAQGYWFIEPSPVKPNHIRVWLVGSVEVNKAIPGFIVDYGSERALPRAFSWVKPQIEAEFRKNQRKFLNS